MFKAFWGLTSDFWGVFDELFCKWLMPFEFYAREFWQMMENGIPRGLKPLFSGRC
jgi:hypothetical protein